MNRKQCRAAQARSRGSWRQRLTARRGSNPKAAVRGFELMDAHALRPKHPKTVEVLDAEDIATFGPGKTIKVGMYFAHSNGETGRGIERVWVDVLSVEDGVYRGRIDNQLIRRGTHGL